MGFSDLLVQAVFRTCKMVPGARILKCAGPGLASKPPTKAPEGSTKRPGGRAGGAFAELLEQPSPEFRSCLNSQLRRFRSCLNKQFRTSEVA
eukprot:4388348-Alexandrium_andersonii.AAC.1